MYIDWIKRNELDHTSDQLLFMNARTLPGWCLEAVFAELIVSDMLTPCILNANALIIL